MTPRDRAIRAIKNAAVDGIVSREHLIEQVTTAIQAAHNEELERARAREAVREALKKFRDALRNSRQEDVAEFHRKFGVPIAEKPGWPDQKRVDLRVNLIAEEFCEFLTACGYAHSLTIWAWDDAKEDTYSICEIERHEPPEEPQLPAAADALVDLEYVILGSHCELGIKSQPLWDEVHAANMRKEGGATRADGKICKPEGFVPPDIAARLKEQGLEEV